MTQASDAFNAAAQVGLSSFDKRTLDTVILGIKETTDANSSAAGTNTQVQYNDNGDFGASANFTWTSVDDLLTVGGNLKLSATGDATTTDTGIYSPGADQLAISTGGTGRVFVDANGNVGVGTANPVTQFHIQKAIGGLAGVQISTSVHGSTLTDGLFVGIDNSLGYLYQYENLPLVFGTNSQERLRITSTGRVGIGTSSPTKNLEVASAGGPTLRLRNTTSYSTGSLNEPVGIIEFSSADGSLSDPRAVIAARFSNEFGQSSYLDFQLRDGSNTLSSVLRLDPAGNVGIGTLSPAHKLTIQEDGTTANAELALNYIGASAGRTAMMRFQKDSNNFGYIAGATAMLTSGNADDLGIAPVSGKNLLFGIGTAERARIDSSGRLLVGTSSSYGSFPAILQTQNNNGYAALFGKYSDNSSGPDVEFFKGRGGSAFVRGIVQDNDQLGVIVFSGDDGLNGSRQGASIRSEVDGTPGANDMPGRLVFSTTADGASSPTERMRIDSAGYLRLSVNSGGIQFNGDTAAANALDDYEEGTFTPIIYGLGTAGTLTYTRQTGRYIKVGGIVHVSVELKIDAISVAPTSDLVLGGLPFTSANIEANFAYTGALRTNGVDLPAGAAGVFGIILNNGTIARLQVNTDDGLPTGIPGSGISAGDEFGFTTSYRTV